MGYRIHNQIKSQGRIHVLTEQTIDQIAAGEVIENPASVVKELFENAVDAGATHIVIEILGGGFQSIRLSDNGSGMSEEDAILCLKRHATSKIQSADDLMRLDTMGFRGEALASIAAISKMTLSTALQDSLGIELNVEGGQVISVQPSARAMGTTVDVCSLFYNVPARKKFQKTAGASSAEITRVVTLLALGHPYIGVELIQQRKTLFSVSSDKEEKALLDLLQKRSADLLGEHFQSPLHRVHFQDKNYELQGLIGDPRLTRYNRSGQYLFVNARPVHCFPLTFAIRDGYGTRLDSNRHPLYVIHAKIEPSLIDVNVHPQKKEIRFQDEETIKKCMRTAVSVALQRAEMPMGLEIDIPAWQLRESPSLAKGMYDAPLFSPEIRGISCEREVENQSTFSLKQDPKAIGVFEHYLLIEAHSFPLSRLLEQNKDGVVWIDLLAAEARILFERLLSSQAKQHSQGLLLPITFSCSKAEAEKLTYCLSALEELGLQLRSIGPTVFMVDAIPDFLEEKEVHNMLQGILSALEEKVYCLQEQKIRQCAQTLCGRCRSRTRAYTLDEGLHVFKQLARTSDPLYCPQGKPIFYHLKKDEIGSYFTHRK